MNEQILTSEVQQYIDAHLYDDANRIALSKSPFSSVSPSELASQIVAKKKSLHKLPTWNRPYIYFPPLLSIEQSSSEATARYKAGLAEGDMLLDLTAGFGVDSYYFCKKVKTVLSCEINPELVNIATHNSEILGVTNIEHLATDGIALLLDTPLGFDTIYVDPARRNKSQKVFRLKDCTPDVTAHLDLLMAKGQRIIIKTSPLLDISAGLSELKKVIEIHIVSVKNECKELLWIIEDTFVENAPIIVCTTLNEGQKSVTIATRKKQIVPSIVQESLSGYLYEPDVALLKSGEFNWIGQHFGLEKLHAQTHLYVKNEVQPDFIGRIFKIDAVVKLNEIKKDKTLTGNVLVRNFPERAEVLANRHHIKPNDHQFVIFTQTISGYVVIKATIIQHY